MTTVFSFNNSYNLSLSTLASDSKYTVWVHGSQELTETDGVHGIQKARAWADPDDLDVPDDASAVERRLALIKEASSGADEHITVSRTDPEADGWEHITPDELVDYVGLQLRQNIETGLDVDADAATDLPTPDIEADVGLVEMDDVDPDPVPDVPLVEVDEATLGGRWYLSVVLPEQVKPVTQWMHDRGETDEFIGKVVLHDMHDYNRSQDCVHLFTVRNTAGEQHYGVIVVIPDRDEYAHFFDDTSRDVPRWRWSDVQVRAYGVPSERVVMTLINEFVDVEEWTNNELGVWQR